MVMQAHVRNARAAGLATPLLVLAVLVALVASGANANPTASRDLTPKAAALRDQMDKLWQAHVTWTRVVIIDFAAGLPDLQFAEARLLQNQVDIGDAFKPYYGDAAGDRLTALLKTHILQAVDVLEAAKAGDQAKLAAALAAWYANAHEIAVFLSSLNPHNWPVGATTRMMNEHLKLTTDEAVARLTGDWAADIQAYDKVVDEILMMADTLSDGIIAQFPDRF